MAGCADGGTPGWSVDNQVSAGAALRVAAQAALPGGGGTGALPDGGGTGRLPGGDAIGPRPLGMRQSGLRALGATTTIEHGRVVGAAARLTGAAIGPDFPSFIAATGSRDCVWVFGRGRSRRVG